MHNHKVKNENIKKVLWYLEETSNRKLHYNISDNCFTKNLGNTEEYLRILTINLCFMYYLHYVNWMHNGQFKSARLSFPTFHLLNGIWYQILKADTKANFIKLPNAPLQAQLCMKTKSNFTKRLGLPFLSQFQSNTAHHFTSPLKKFSRIPVWVPAFIYGRNTEKRRKYSCKA
jgi:hypothetical protein